MPTPPTPWRLANRARSLLSLLLTVSSLPAATRQTDLIYGEAGGETLRLDVSIPDRNGPFPVVILIHGGGWGSGDKDGAAGTGADITPWFDPLDDRFTWFSINYRLAPEHPWPACYEDVLTALEWVRKHASTYKGNPGQIALMGHSAGGQLAAMSGVHAGSAAGIRAVVGCAAATNFEQDLEARGGVSLALRNLYGIPQTVTPTALSLLRDGSPLNHLRSGTPPFLLVHGDADRSVPLQQSLDFRKRAEAVGVPCELLILKGAPHRLTEWVEHEPAWMDSIVNWLEDTLAQPPSQNSPTAPAFPGAEGYGASATGGRGGAVIAVTNLDDSGPGSLRAAVETPGPRTIVFQVSGTIALASDLTISEGDLTVAGQTAPGDGITLANYSLKIDADNVIVRFLRVRVGDEGSREGASGRDSLACRFTDRVIVDHCSFSWSIDETASAYQNTNFTMQWCIVSESLRESLHHKGPHGYGGIWGGYSATFHHNLLAHHSSRNPRFNGNARLDDSAAADRTDVRNNVFYNWGDNSGYGGEPTATGIPSLFNLVGNYYKPGPATRPSTDDRIFHPDPIPGDPAIYSHYYIADNVTEGTPETSADNWRGVDGLEGVNPAAVRLSVPILSTPLSTQTAENAYAAVLAYAGSIAPRRDSVDERILAEVATGTAQFGNHGIINSQREVGGFPLLESTPAPVDRDADGIPDSWEHAHGLDPENPADRNSDSDGNGYTQLEDYLNSLAVGAFPNPH